MAQLKNTNISDTGNLSLPQGTTAQRPGSPVAGMIRYNTTVSDTEYYDGSAWRPISDSNPEATGGTIVDTDIGGVAYRLHLFTNTGNTTFTVSKGGEVEYLIVAGGGGGGRHSGGGGGAGGLLAGTTSVTAQAYTITVGAGGNGPPVGTYPTIIGGIGTNGGNSVFGSLTAIGGGKGAWYAEVAGSGGSGGGASGHSGNGPGAGTAGQGFAGGNGPRNSPGYSSSGGGGAGEPGFPGIRDASPGILVQGGAGGRGLSSNIIGTLTYYAGGGGGNVQYGGTFAPGGAGGIGGGGAGSNGISDPLGNQYGYNGTPFTGGGGGGTHYNAPATATAGREGRGGSGIVIIRYPRNGSTVTTPTQLRKSTLPYSSTAPGFSPLTPASSGYELALSNPRLPSGYYWIQSYYMPSPLQMYVDMQQEGGGFDFYVITGGIPADRARANSTVFGVGVEGTAGTLSNGYGALNSGIPLGLDIIYPRSSAHWLAIYNFTEGVLGGNINSYFTSNMGAVHRTVAAGQISNYTSFPMRDPRFYGTGAPDWRVPDGGRWWLSDVAYSEPNGDYAAYGFLGNRGIPRPYTLNTNVLFNDLASYSQTTGPLYLVSTNTKP